jgi:hypothetical protein
LGLIIQPLCLDFHKYRVTVQVVGEIRSLRR